MWFATVGLSFTMVVMFTGRGGRFGQGGVFDQVLSAERLVGEAHVHDFRGVALGGGKVYQTAFCKQDY
jgi:hypothetical protein